MESLSPPHKKHQSWEEYENAVFEECKRVFHFQDAEIVRNVRLLGNYSGVKRQIDVLIRLRKDGVITSTILVECKHYSVKINVKIVDAFIGCLQDLEADKGVIVSEKGFTKAAINRAHRGKNDIEVDILSLEELKRFQAQGAFPYSDRNALALSAPFGWIIDCKRRGFAPAVLYRRGIAFEEATTKEKEWMYLQFWDKSSQSDTLENLVAEQNESLKDQDEDAVINIENMDGLLVRRAFLPSYPTPEITVFREFDFFIAFVVIYCPEHYINRNTKKVISMLLEAIPIQVIRKEES